MSELDRLRWHCRRGLLELDLVLSRFLEREWPHLSPGQRAAFKLLLEHSDTELWDLVCGRSQPDAGDAAVVVGLLREL
jgi:succinate dehydrogenase flavin-adding protein (antitoxin of CptAB toxin-antitoxin module)